MQVSLEEVGVKECKQFVAGVQSSLGGFCHQGAEGNWVLINSVVAVVVPKGLNEIL